MRGVDALAVYALWRRDLLRFVRARSRLVGTFVTPLFLVAFLGFGFEGVRLSHVPESVSYLEHPVPGILGFVTLFSASFSGLAVLSDREVGFLKEILVAPVPRTSVVLGRIAAGATTGRLQSALVLAGTPLVGFRPASVAGLAVAAAFLVGLSTAFVGFGPALAAGFRDTQGYSLVVNFVLFPLAFLSGAFYPLSNLPPAIRWLGYLNPLTYGIDGLRGMLVGAGAATYPLWLDLGAGAGAGAVTVLVGAWLFDRVEAA
ncbi:multidrug ABC transporter permease [Halobacteriales archaeon QS_5_70_15]|nr:MAG: multidrug ABC transporter permease [Halobacteriales archaeon QS_5_70_15]